MLEIVLIVPALSPGQFKTFELSKRERVGMETDGWGNWRVFFGGGEERGERRDI